MLYSSLQQAADPPPGCPEKMPPSTTSPHSRTYDETAKRTITSSSQGSSRFLLFNTYKKYYTVRLFVLAALGLADIAGYSLLVPCYCTVQPRKIVYSVTEGWLWQTTGRNLQ